MKAWMIIWAWLAGGAIQAYTYHRHLTTDPACKHYCAPHPGSRLDKWSRGLSCNPCMVSAAFGEHECYPFTVSTQTSEL